MSASRIAFSARCVERWYSEIAASGPTSAAIRYGVRCQSTTSISAVDAISVNGSASERAFDDDELEVADLRARRGDRRADEHEVDGEEDHRRHRDAQQDAHGR